MSITVYRTPNIWSSVYNPIMIGFTSDKVPPNAFHPDATTNNGGLLSIVRSGTQTVGDYIYIVSQYDGIYQGAYQIVADDGSFWTLNVPWQINSGILWGVWYNNYKIALQLYIETTPNSGNYTLLVQTYQRADQNNNFLIDLAPYIRTVINYDNPGAAGEIQTGANTWRKFYVAYTEIYDIAVAKVPTPTLGTWTTLKIGGCSGPALITGVSNQDDSGGGEATWQPWSTSGLTGGAVNTDAMTPNSKYLAYSTGGIINGKKYCITFTIVLAPGASITFFEASNSSFIAGPAVFKVSKSGTYTFCFTGNITYPNLCFQITGTTAGDPTASTLSGLSFEQYLTCVQFYYAHNSTDQYIEQPNASDKLNKYVITGAGQNTPFLTTYPRNLKKGVRNGDYELLSFIANYAVAYYFHVDFYDINNNITGSSNVSLGSLNPGRYDLAVAVNGNMAFGYSSTTVYYKVYVSTSATPGTGVLTEQFAYQIDTKCYTFSYRVHWLNLKGGWGSYWFNAKIDYSGVIERLGEIKRNLFPDNFGPENVQNEYLAHNYIPTFQLSSAGVPLDEFEWLFSLAYAKQVRMEFVIDGVRQFIPMKVTTDKVHKYKDGDKLRVLSLELQYAYDAIIQTS